MSIAPVQTSIPKAEGSFPKPPVMVGRFELVKDEEVPERVKQELDKAEKLKIAKSRTLELLISCIVPFQPLGSDPVTQKSYNSPIYQFVVSRQKILSKQMGDLSEKYRALHRKLYLLIRNLGRDIAAHPDAEEPPTIWFQRRNKLAQLLFSSKSGLKQGVQQDIDQLHQHLLSCVSAQESVRKQKASEKQEIEFPDVFGDEPIKIQTEEEFFLMKTFYTTYSQLLRHCIKYTREFAKPIYRAIGIIECFPDKLHLLDLVKQEEKEGKEQKECPAKS